MDRTLRQCAIAAIFAFTAGCSSGEFTADAGQNIVKKPVKCVPTKTKSCAPKGPGDPTNPPGDPIISDKPVQPVQPVLQVDNGGIAVNVKVTKIHIRVVVDHVTDFYVTPTEIYAVHHELVPPNFALIELYDAEGKVIDTQNWDMSFPNCNLVKGQDANCISTKIQLKAGLSIQGNFKNATGRGVKNHVYSKEKGMQVQIRDCGSDCSGYGGSGRGLSGTDTYEWTID